MLRDVWANENRALSFSQHTAARMILEGVNMNERVEVEEKVKRNDGFCLLDGLCQQVVTTIQKRKGVMDMVPKRPSDGASFVDR